MRRAFQGQLRSQVSLTLLEFQNLTLTHYPFKSSFGNGSLKPFVMQSAVLVPLRSKSAFVATVVPIRIDSILE